MTAEEDREAMVAVLAGLGVDAADVPESLSDAAAMASDVVIARDDRHSLADIATKTGIPTERLDANFRRLGLVVTDPEAVLFNDDDIALASFLHSAIDSILTDEEGAEILHVVSTALSTIAEAAVAGHVQGPERRTTDFVDNARLNAAIAELGLELGQHVAVAFRHHLRQAAHVNRRTQSTVSRDLIISAVGFLDLVGFTQLSQDLDVTELVELVKQFEASAYELAHQHSTRIVKLIGDEVMFVAEHGEDAAAFAISLVASFDDERVVPRGGVAHGELVNIHGDFFGPVVNLAARLVDVAVSGEVLVDDAMAAAKVTTEPAGRRMLKGFDDPVSVHTLLP